MLETGVEERRLICGQKIRGESLQPEISLRNLCVL
jgi:hypothetical protein